MSLRPTDRSRRSDRPRSRSRSRDTRPLSPTSTADRKSKTKKSARSGDDDGDGEPERAVPGVLEPEPLTKRGSQEVPKATPGLSTLAAGLPLYDDREADDTDDDYEAWQARRRLSRAENASASKGVAMPSFPGLSEDDHTNLSPRTSRQNSAARPAYPMYPDESSGTFASMPSADYSTLRSSDRQPDLSIPKVAIMSPSPSRRPQSKHTESYGGHEVPHELPALPRSMSYQYDSEIRSPRFASDKTDEKKPRSNRLSVSDPKTQLRAPSPSGLRTDMNRLSVSGGRSDATSLGIPPASPLLEAYKGTYQSISPIPSPMMLARDLDDDDIEPLSPIESFRPGSKDSNTNTSDFAATNKTAKRRVVIYDSEADAKAIWTALDHIRHIDTAPLIRILPGLTHDQLLELRETYRKTYRKAGEKVDIAKHIKMQTDGHFGKLCFVTASGKWKSEAYWANTWYQSHAASRELLIEALMGRPNSDIREIKKAFRDRRYDDDLARCMYKELKADKFKEAVLMVLEEERQEETDAWPVEYRNRDVYALRQALTGQEGGERAILKIVCKRSDKHLAEVLKSYQGLHGSSFARDALKKSNNLVVSLGCEEQTGDLACG